MQAQKLSIIFQKPPYQTPNAQDAIDFTLAAAAFIKDVQVFFIEDGIYQLLHQQQAPLGLSNLAKQIPILHNLDIERVYADAKSIQLRQIKTTDLIQSIKIIKRDEIKTLMQSSNMIVSY
ncbi:MAG: sulfurtransferase complex subunit TusC [Pseudomonadota bacterium]